MLYELRILEAENDNGSINSMFFDSDEKRDRTGAQQRGPGAGRNQAGNDRQARDDDPDGGRGWGSDRLPAGDLLWTILLRRANDAVVRVDRTRTRGSNGTADDEPGEGIGGGPCDPHIRGRGRRGLLQYGCGDWARRSVSGQIPEDAYPARCARILGKVLFSTGKHGLSGIRSGILQDRRLYLLRPALSRRCARSGVERRRACLQS